MHANRPCWPNKRLRGSGSKNNNAFAMLQSDSVWNKKPVCVLQQNLQNERGCKKRSDCLLQLRRLQNRFVEKQQRKQSSSKNQISFWQQSSASNRKPQFWRYLKKSSGSKLQEEHERRETVHLQREAEEELQRQKNKPIVSISLTSH